MQDTLVQFLDDSLEKGQATYFSILGLPCGSASKESPAMQETWILSLGWEDPLEKGKATHSCILA